MRTINAQVTGARQQQLFTAGEQNHGVSQFLELDSVKIFEPSKGS